MIHQLKTDPEIFVMEANGTKPFMFRVNDRDFKEGDVIISRETEYNGTDMKKAPEAFPCTFTGRVLIARITLVFKGPFYTLPEGSCIMAFETLFYGKECK